MFKIEFLVDINSRPLPSKAKAINTVFDVFEKRTHRPCPSHGSDHGCHTGARDGTAEHTDHVVSCHNARRKQGARRAGVLGPARGRTRPGGAIRQVPHDQGPADSAEGARQGREKTRRHRQRAAQPRLAESAREYASAQDDVLGRVAAQSVEGILSARAERVRGVAGGQSR